MHRVQETIHFLNGVRNQYSLEVVAIFQSATDTGSNGIHVFEHRTVFDTRHVITDRCFDKTASQTACEDTCLVFIRAGDSQVGESLQSYFFCVAGTCKDCYVFWWHTIFFCEVFRYNNVVIGYDSFDSGDDKLIFYLGFQFFQMRLQIRRGSDEDQCIRFFHNIVDVGTESDASRIKFHSCQISRIVP